MANDGIGSVSAGGIIVGKTDAVAMKKEVLTHEEIYAEIRKFRMLDVDQVEAVVMELNGELTVIKKTAGVTHRSLQDLENG